MRSRSSRRGPIGERRGARVPLAHQLGGSGDRDGEQQRDDEVTGRVGSNQVAERDRRRRADRRSGGGAGVAVEASVASAAHAPYGGTAA